MRRSSPSGRGPPGPNRGSYFWNSTSVAPKLWKLLTMLLLKPVTIDTMAMTVATPTTMPSTVRDARSLCARTARNAKRTFSPNPRRRPLDTPDMEFSVRFRRVYPPRASTGAPATDYS